MTDDSDDRRIAHLTTLCGTTKSWFVENPLSYARRAELKSTPKPRFCGKLLRTFPAPSLYTHHSTTLHGSLAPATFHHTNSPATKFSPNICTPRHSPPTFPPSAPSLPPPFMLRSIQTPTTRKGRQ